MNRTLLAFTGVALAALTLTAGHAPAQSAADEIDRAEQARAFAESVVTELDLTEAQQEQVRDILEAGAARREALMRQAQDIRASSDSMRTRFRQMKSLRSDAQAHAAAQRQALAEVLDEAQMEQLDALVAEKRAQLETELRASRSR